MNQRSIFYALLFIGVAASMSSAQTFRGLPLDQGFNRHSSPVLGDAWFIDVRDTFSAPGRSPNLSNSRADDIVIGFVPPTTPAPSDINDFGRWMGSTDYSVDSLSGSVSRRTASSVEVTCIPWRVTPELGNIYLIETSATVAEGESVRLAYFGNVVEHGTQDGLLSSNLGQLVVDITRGVGSEANTVTWTIDSPQLDNPISDVLVHSLGDDIRLQLGWNEDDNLFDAWLESNGINQRLSAGSLNGPLDVFGFGIELTGTNSRVHQITAAVPEPSSQILIGFALLPFIGSARRRRN